MSAAPHVANGKSLTSNQECDHLLKQIQVKIGAKYSKGYELNYGTTKQNGKYTFCYFLPVKKKAAKKK